MDFFNQLSEKDYLTSNNFLNFSNTFYGAYVPKKELIKYDKENYRVLLDENGGCLIKNKSFKLKENDTIFCHTMLLEPLFNHLNNISNLKNIKLITHQSDLPIGKREFLKKPNCISKWYGININYDHEDLVAIPIGIGNFYNEKTLTSMHFEKINIFSSKTNKVYMNFNMNTNYFHRYNAYKYLFKKNFVVDKKPTLDLNDYIKNINKYKFSLAPWGNGYDTHRLWESLYAGAIPITLSHSSLLKFSDFPIVFLDKYKNFDIENEKFKKIKYFYNEKLNINWWFNLINESNIKTDTREIEIKEDDELHAYNVKLFFNLYHKQNKIKQKNTIKRKLHKNLFGSRIYKNFGV